MLRTIPQEDGSTLQDALDLASPEVQRILTDAWHGQEISEADGKILFDQRAPAAAANRNAIYATADAVRAQVNGDQVSFVVNRNINFTNVCYMGCRFCGFAKRKEDADAIWLSPGDVARRAQEAWDRGGTEVCIQGGLHPKMPGTYYRDLVLAIKDAVPDLHIHAFSPFEVWYGARKRRMGYADFIADLKACGLGSMPGTAAEILDTEVRQQLTQNKLSADAWETIIRAAHGVGLPTTATIMYGHVDGPSHWAAHLARLRSIQRDTGGFTELVPLSFVHTESPLYTLDPEAVRPGPTVHEVGLMHAVARLMLHGFIDNIQVSWTKLGPEHARQVLRCGANDLGGCLMNESISRAAGSRYGQEMTARELCTLIRSAERVPMQRTTLYGPIEVFDDHDPGALAPLVPRLGADPLAFLNTVPEGAR